MGDEELRDELVTLLLAGHETTATSVAWAIERLVRHPAALERLLAEVDAGDGEHYMNAVISETMRVRPVVPLGGPRAEQGDGGGRHALPAGTRVVPSIYLTNRSPRAHERPQEFRPERFLDESPDTFSWIPFGGGIRRCIGASFAQMEMRVILTTILAELEPRTAPGAWPGEESGSAAAPSRWSLRTAPGSAGSAAPPQYLVIRPAGGSWPGVRVACMSCTRRH